jgi:hypothetical protein
MRPSPRSQRTPSPARGCKRITATPLRSRRCLQATVSPVVTSSCDVLQSPQRRRGVVDGWASPRYKPYRRGPERRAGQRASSRLSAWCVSPALGQQGPQAHLPWLCHLLEHCQIGRAMGKHLRLLRDASYAPDEVPRKELHRVLLSTTFRRRPASGFPVLAFHGIRTSVYHRSAVPWDAKVRGAEDVSPTCPSVFSGVARTPYRPMTADLFSSCVLVGFCSIPPVRKGKG